MKNIFLLILLSPFSLYAAKHIAVITNVKGDGKILSLKYKKGPQLLYEGQTYRYKKAKIGDKLKPANLVMCASNCKIKLIYKNGDTFFVGPGSALKTVADEKVRNTSQAVIHMFYGKLRAIISKKGPRKKLKVRTKSLTSGVRGTDFYIEHYDAQGTEVTVLRGKVALHKEKTPEKVREISSSEKVEAIKIEHKEIKVAKINKFTKGDVLAVYNNSSSDFKEVKEEHKELEEASKTIIIADIKAEDPELHKKISSAKDIKFFDVEKAHLNKLLKKAPVGEVFNFDSIEDDVESYEKYF